MAPARSTKPSAQTNFVLEKMEVMQKSLDEVLARVTTMATDMKGEVRGIRRKLDDFGEDLDGVKRRLVNMDWPAAATTRVNVPTAADKGVIATARLVTAPGSNTAEPSDCAVRLQAPTSITKAASLARMQEEEMEHHSLRGRPAAPTKHPPFPPAVNQNAAATRTDWPTDDFNRERQLHDFRRANGLCFKCGDKYSEEHQCKRSNRLLTIEVGEFGEILSDEAVLAMELSDASLPAATAHPLEMNDLLSEILLRLPPQPSSLPRARAVSKYWCSLASDARFCARFRAHHRRNPPLLGCFLEEDPLWLDPEEGRFQFQALEAPNRVPKGRFTFPIAPDADVTILGCRHGLVLVINERQDQLLVWDPVTGDEHRLDIPPGFDRAVVSPVSGAVLRAAGDDLHHFQVVLVGRCKTQHAREIIASVYSSSTGAWGNLVSTPIPLSVEDDAFIYPSKPAVMIGNSLYWLLMGYPIEIVEFDLDCSSLALIPTPGEISTDEPLTTDICVIPAHGGGLGYLFLSDINAQLWKRKTNCDGVASWVLGRVIALDKLTPINSDEDGEGLRIIGVAEENDMVILRSLTSSIFTVHLEPLESKKIFSNGSSYLLWPFEGVYTAEGFSLHRPGRVGWVFPSCFDSATLTEASRPRLRLPVYKSSGSQSRLQAPCWLGLRVMCLMGITHPPSTVQSATEMFCLTACEKNTQW